MEAVIYTKDNDEFSQLESILQEERITVSRDPLDGFGHYERGYGLVIVALEGAEGMIAVRNWSEMHRDAKIIWITSDSYFAGEAIERHIHDFIVRPYERERLRASIRRIQGPIASGNIWHFGRTGRSYPEDP